MPANPPRLSIVAPALNEQGNLEALVAQVKQNVIDAGVEAELIVVDDGSTDGTWAELASLAPAHPWLRLLRLNENRGQSLAMGVGVEAARGACIATLDADLQNDPADLPGMLEQVERGDADFVQGRRTRRRDTRSKRWASGVGILARRWVLGDTVRDTGCSARVVRAVFAKQWPLHWRGMHRFLPVYSRMCGARVVEVPVNHRPRHAGRSKYTSLRRGATAVFDLLAVRWMLTRYRGKPEIEEPSRER